MGIGRRIAATCWSLEPRPSGAASLVSSGRADTPRRARSSAMRAPILWLPACFDRSLGGTIGTRGAGATCELGAAACEPRAACGTPVPVCEPIAAGAAGRAATGELFATCTAGGCGAGFAASAAGAGFAAAAGAGFAAAAGAEAASAGAEFAAAAGTGFARAGGGTGAGAAGTAASTWAADGAAP